MNTRHRPSTTRPHPCSGRRKLTFSLLVAATVVAVVAPPAGAAAPGQRGAPPESMNGHAVPAKVGERLPEAAAARAQARSNAFATLIEHAQVQGTQEVTITLADLPESAPVNDEQRLAERRSIGQEAAEGHAAVRAALRTPAARQATVDPADTASADGPVPPSITVRVDAGQLRTLQGLDEVKTIQESRSVGLQGTTSFGAANGVQLPKWWHRNRIGLDWTTQNGYGGAGQVVVVIDTGVQTDHSWLSGRIAGEACFSQTGCGNGATYQYGAGSAKPCSYSYGCAHGTHVAHIAAGAYGVATSARVFAIKAAYQGTDANGRTVPLFHDTDLINALWYTYYYVAPKPASVNLSVGGGQFTSTCDSRNPSVTSYISALRTAGVPTVIAAGNDNYSNAIGFPACVSTAVVVGNTTMTAASGGTDAVLGNVVGGSNSSPLVDLLAPGTDICSAVPVTLDADGIADGVACDFFGTSMAAPQVAGAWAVMRGARSGYTLNQILSALQRRGTSVSDSRNGIVRTRINVANSVYYG